MNPGTQQGYIKALVQARFHSEVERGVLDAVVDMATVAVENLVHYHPGQSHYAEDVATIAVAMLTFENARGYGVSPVSES